MCCIYVLSLRRESLDMILEDESIIIEEVMSQRVIVDISLYESTIFYGI
jgi:hypothetical protein